MGLFHSKEFKDFAKYLDIKHRRITPLWPQANSSAENFNRRIRKVIQSAKLEQKNWKQEMYRFLRNYRATPHSSTDKSPSVFSNRPYRTRLPEIKPMYEDAEIREKDGEAKRKMKMYADNHMNIKKLNFEINDMVLVKQKRVNKFTPPFNPEPLVIISMKGSMITAKSTTTQKEITRNSSFFKKIIYQEKKENYEVLDEENSNSNSDENVVDVDVDNYVENLQVGDEDPIIAPRRNPLRRRNRPQYLQKDIENLLNTDE